MPTNPKADQTVEIVGAGADYKVQVVGDQVVDLSGATPGDVLVVQPDGSLAPQAAAAGGGVSSVNTRTGAVVGLAEQSALTAEASTARTAEALAAQKAANLSDLASAATARTNLGLGTAATQAIGAFDAAGAAAVEAAARSAADALLLPIANPTATGVATAPSFSATGKSGATAQATVLAGGTASGAPATGAHVVGELVLDATGAAWYCTTAGTPGTWVQIGARTGLLGLTSYNPASAGQPAATSATFVDVDATNLLVTFTAPPSGRVVAALTALGVVATASGTILDWNLRSGSSDVTGTNATMAYQDNIADIERRLHHRCVVSGLTPGTSYSYKWGHARRAGSGSASTQYGGALGAAVMEVWSA